MQNQLNIYGVGNSSTVRLNKILAINERAVDACSNFLYAILDLTTAISVRPGSENTPYIN
eukprot:1161773-Pelagomonas_calceolata.AAC.33